MMHSLRNFGVGASLLVAALVACSSQGASGSDQTPLEGDNPSADNPVAGGSESACPHDEDGKSGCGQDGGTVTPPTICSEGQAAAILDALDMGEVNESTLVVDASIDAKVREFARLMVKDHGAHRDALKALVAKLNISIVTNGISKELTKDSERDVAASATLSATEIQSHYVNRQVLGHIRALGILEGLLHTHEHAELKAFVKETRTTVRHHLKMILDIQAKLVGSCGGSITGNEPGCDDAGNPLPPQQPPAPPTPQPSSPHPTH
ncbi:DUF4142 domain-containing protein [Pendulispora albinea]|uniref:DUF4142 domain-containing protein n=1 Tax=Pendulispora albinea TaxID=2741071 RepID=A0ABZ2LYK9_9BACT